MPRRARTYLPGYPYHMIQRGNNREGLFSGAGELPVLARGMA